MTEHRHFTGSAVNLRHVLDGTFVRFSCFRCSFFGYPICKETGEDIRFPVSGPVGKQCPLPTYEFPEAAPCIEQT